GTGKEMFKGFIKAIGIIAVLYGAFILMMYLRIPILGFLVLFGGIACLLPLIIHGSYKYRMSRSSWRGIHFGYRGDLKTLFGICLKGAFFTLITFGIYGSWFQMNLRNYVLGNVRYGSSRFQYKGDGGDYFVMNLVGYLLTLITFGIYSAWWMRDRFKYYVDNLSWHFPDGKHMEFRSSATGGAIFGLMITNILLLVFTLGLGYAWVEVRTLNFVMANIGFVGEADLDQVVQTESENKNAMADDLGDLLDIGIFI
ncbi:MAG TPA: DUF898 family protein, partial [Flavobacteriales bacterium]|nr:DUF898 family protein [Flavobacteriales bacterium]